MLKTEQPGLDAGRFKLLAIVVLYKMAPRESVTLRSLEAALSSLPFRREVVSILLYDNTPGGQDPGPLPAGVRYKADPENGGLAKAYNYALDVAHEEGFDWLLTLDQDTTLPADFMTKLYAAAISVAPLNKVAAIVPSVSGDGRVISPSRPIKYWLLTRQFPQGFVGVSPEKTTIALNSASTFRVNALISIGGYDPRFWLDFSDIVLFHLLGSNNLKVFIAGNIHVEHQISVSDLMNRATPDRYECIHQAEEAFYDEFLGRVERAVLVLRLLYHLVYRLFTQHATLPYFAVVFRFLCRRLFYSRRHRMEDWKEFARLRTAS
jgi:GT2 family glycosyltransferase